MKTKGVQLRLVSSAQHGTPRRTTVIVPADHHRSVLRGRGHHGRLPRSRIRMSLRQ